MQAIAETLFDTAYLVSVKLRAPPNGILIHHTVFQIIKSRFVIKSVYSFPCIIISLKIYRTSSGTVV